jgi:hypothetical protein
LATIGSTPTIGVVRRSNVWIKRQHTLRGRSAQCHIPLHFDPEPARITGWYDGSDSGWSTDHKRQKLFDNKRDASPVCEELRSRCRRNAVVINEVAQDDARKKFRV